ncbi:hypothetical protein HRbin21_01272 [bacterium HR21]|nr:hypothetical protein HRbin21_01272 [bacterium HR21]
MGSVFNAWCDSCGKNTPHTQHASGLVTCNVCGASTSATPTGWITAYCPQCGKRIRHIVSELGYATCTVCGNRWKYR